MSALCGAVALRGRPQSPDALAGVLAALAPHGTAGSSVVHAAWGPVTATVAAVWDDPAALDADRRAEAAGAPVRVLGSVDVFNRPALAAELGLAAASHDLELVAAAWERWGEDLPHHVHGDFALAVVDIRRRGVFLVRDHAGHASLVEQALPDRVAFATNALALTGLDGVGHELDDERVAEVLALAYHTPRTFVAGVRWVGPGSARWVDVDGVRQWQWWQPGDDLVDLGSLDAHADTLRAAFDEAVSGSLHTSGGLGATVSGGLDSSSVAATAARHHTGDLTTWTSKPPDAWVPTGTSSRDHDEYPLVLDLARLHPNLRPRPFITDGARLFDHHRNLWELGAGPLRNPCNAQWMFGITEEAAASGVTLLLTGAHGNIAFSADGPRWLVALAARGRARLFGAEVTAWARSHDRSRPAVLRSEFLALLQPTFLRTWRHRRHGVRSRAQDWRRATAVQEPVWDEWQLEERIAGLAYPDGTTWTRRLREQFAAGGTQADHQAAARALWGVTQRDPTVDRRVLAVAMPQPEWWRRHDGWDRAVVRRAMADRLPPSITQRMRRGAQLPDWYERLEEARPQITDEVEQMHDHPLSRRLIDTPRLDALVRAWPRPGSPGTGETDHVRDYRLALSRAVHVSRYVRWFEERARRVASGGPAVVVDHDAGFGR